MLRRWATGTYDQKVYFTAASYEPHYKRHLAALHQFQARDPLAFHTVRAEIWRMAWCARSHHYAGLLTG